MWVAAPTLISTPSHQISTNHGTQNAFWRLSINFIPNPWREPVSLNGRQAFALPPSVNIPFQTHSFGPRSLLSTIVIPFLFTISVTSWRIWRKHFQIMNIPNSMAGPLGQVEHGHGRLPLRARVSWAFED
jgi:hypothetical protein